MSPEGMFFAADARDASVFDRGLKGDADCTGDAGVLVGVLENAGCDGERVAETSDPAECDREDIGTVKLCKLWFDGCGELIRKGRVRSS
jgi:hypothetical protein